MTEVNNEEKKGLTEEEQEDKKELDATLGLGDGPEFDSSKVKFINGAADTRLEIDQKEDTAAFCGLTKEELKKYADDPYWVRVRWILLILFWLIWVGMLAAAIIIIIVAPKCPPRPKLDWWQKEVIYQAYPKSFKDTNDDGVGDIKGIKEKLDHLSNLNVKALWLNPMYKSPMVDAGYDISDYKMIDPMFGTMEDFDHLITDMHKKDMKLIMDFVPNHTSRNHTWFQASCKKEGKYRDYYIWHEGSDKPNNWLSVFGGSAWTEDDECGGYYYHQFYPEQPDLNLRNEDVQNEIKDALMFWLDKGVDGFRVDAVSHLFESEDVTKDEPASSAGGTGYDSLDHTLTTFLPETYEIITDWRELLDEVSSKSSRKRFMMVESYGTENQTSQFYEYNDKKGAHFPQNMGLIGLKSNCNGKCVSDLVTDSLVAYPHHQSWVTGNHDNSRIATKIGEQFVEAVNMLLLLLPGTPTTYYGEEIGMTDNANIPTAELLDSQGRDPYRTPMQWDGTKNAGFSQANKTWLPVNDNYQSVNVKFEMAHGRGFTKLEAYMAVAELRHKESFQWGVFTKVDTKKDSLFAFMRRAEGFQGFLVAINFGPDDVLAEFHAASNGEVPKLATVAASTGNFDNHERSSEFEVGTQVHMDNVFIKVGEGIVFQWEWEDAPNV